jgi:hypothetical protein
MRLAVTINIPTSQGQMVWFAFDHAAGTIEEFHKTLLADGSVIGTRYQTLPGQSNTLVLKRTYSTIIAKDAIFSVAPLHKTITDAAGNPV